MHFTSIFFDVYISWLTFWVISCFCNLIWLTLCGMSIWTREKVIFLLNSSCIVNCRLMYMDRGEKKGIWNEREVIPKPQITPALIQNNGEESCWDNISVSKERLNLGYNNEVLECTSWHTGRSAVSWVGFSGVFRMIEVYLLFAMSERASLVMGGEQDSMEMPHCLTSNDFPYSIAEMPMHQI